MVAWLDVLSGEVAPHWTATQGGAEEKSITVLAWCCFPRRATWLLAAKHIAFFCLYFLFSPRLLQLPMRLAYTAASLTLARRLASTVSLCDVAVGPD